MIEISLVMQLAGALILLASNVWFLAKARRGKYHSLKKEFVDKSASRIAMDEEELQCANADEALTKFPLANLLFKNYINTIVGVGFTMAGVILRGFGI